MRANAALENSVTVKFQMMRGNRRGYIRACSCDKCGRLSCGDVLKDDFQIREVFNDVLQNIIDKDSFAVKDVYVLMGDFAVHQERHSNALHGL